MTLFLLTAAFILAFASSSLLVPIVRRLAIARNWVDRPEGRKHHERPTPNVGGIAIAAGFAIGLVSLLFIADLFSVQIRIPHLALFGGGLAMVVLGFYDDIHGLSFKRKFFFQIVVAYLLVSAGYRFDLSGFSVFEGDPYHEALVSIPLTLIWIVGIINAVNLLDGLDGLASGVSMIIFATLAAIFGINGGDIALVAIAALMIAATAGFLVFNFDPASIFMGDSGSLFIGYMLAAFSIAGPAHADPFLALLVPMVALGLPVLDTGLCMVRRLIDGISPFSPDSDHIHHRLKRLWSTRAAVVILYAVAAWFGIAALLMTQFEINIGLMVIGVTLIAAYVGIRTLGYLDVRQLLPRRIRSRFVPSIWLRQTPPVFDSVESRENGETGSDRVLTEPAPAQFAQSEGDGAHPGAESIDPPHIRSTPVLADSVAENGNGSSDMNGSDNALESSRTNGSSDADESNRTNGSSNAGESNRTNGSSNGNGSSTAASDRETSDFFEFSV